MVPYSLVIIKPLSIGRGYGPDILSEILHACPVSLRLFRSWVICDTTLFALTRDNGPYSSDLDYEVEKIHPPRQIPSWICVFTHIDRKTDPIPILRTYADPSDPKLWTSDSLRSRYSGLSRLKKTLHPSDTVLHISPKERVSYEANMLFKSFDETVI